MTEGRVFLDVGAHNGQTLQEVTRAHYGFARVFAFEPMPEQYRRLVERFGGLPDVTLLNYGLTDANGPQPMYGDNSRLESSLYSEKEDVDASHVTVCQFVQASEFVRHLNGAPLIVKLNCEGAEVPILHDLIASGEIWKVENVMIDFDIRKVPGRELERERVLDAFAAIGFDRYSLCEDVMGGPPEASHQERIATWLRGL